MIKRLLAFLLGRRRAGQASRDPELYPVVGSSADAQAREPESWPASRPGPRDSGADVTLLALPPGPDRGPGEAANRERLAWPARDLSRSRPVQAASPDDATVIVSRFRPEKRTDTPADVRPDATILVTNRGKPRQPPA